MTSALMLSKVTIQKYMEFNFVECGVVTLSGNSLEIIMQKVIKQCVVLPNIMNFGKFCELSLGIIEYLSITEKQKKILLKSVKLTIKFR